MTATSTAAAIVLFLCITALPGRAQQSVSRADNSRDATRVRAWDLEKTSNSGTPAYKVVHGVVQGQQGALPGATVWLHGSRTIVVTNAEGEFELAVPAHAKKVVLTCSYGGLQEEVVHLTPVQSIGSVYLLRAKDIKADQATLGQ